MDASNAGPPAGISQSDWDTTPLIVRELVATLNVQKLTLDERVSALEQQIELLNERLNTNSRNSSKPPSSDPPGLAPRKRKSKGRKRGGQAGHKGHSRKLFPVERCDKVVDHVPGGCGNCGASLTGSDSDPHRHQIFEIPQVAVTVEEHRLHALTCTKCGTKTRAKLPDGVEATGYGPRLTAIVGYLAVHFGASLRKTASAMLDLFGAPLAHSTVGLLRVEQSEAVKPAVDEVHDYIQRQPVVNADETSFARGNGDGGNPERRTGWLWVAVAPLVAVFRLCLSRSAEEAKELLGRRFAGYLIADRYGGYAWIPNRRVQTCWAHLKRTFQKFADRPGKSRTIGEGLIEQTDRLFALWSQVRDGSLERAAFRVRIRPIRQRIRALLEQGAAYEPRPRERTGRAKTARTCRNLLTVWVSLWLFARVDGIEPTNNAAERDIRFAVIWRRLSLGTQSEYGSEFVARMLTVVTTLRKQDRNVLDYLTEACQAYRAQQPHPSLLPDTAE